jgi:hypothetical protein
VKREPQQLRQRQREFFVSSEWIVRFTIDPTATTHAIKVTKNRRSRLRFSSAIRLMRYG